MATKGRYEFTAQEAANIKSFSDWNYEEYSFYAAGEGKTHLSTYITEANPAKKVVLYQVPTADGTGSLAAANRIIIKINGSIGPDGDAALSDEKDIVLDIGDLPFTISGLMISKFLLGITSAASGDGISVLSFH